MYINDNAMLILRQLFAEMALIIHDPHTATTPFMYDVFGALGQQGFFPITECPDRTCVYIVARLRELDKEFNR
jgi:hypothetical protein